MNAQADIVTHAVWMEAVLALSMAVDAHETPAAPAQSAEVESDDWVAQVLVECYN
jgi:hypothetical protein